MHARGVCPSQTRQCSTSMYALQLLHNSHPMGLITRIYSYPTPDSPNMPTQPMSPMILSSTSRT